MTGRIRILLVIAASIAAFGLHSSPTADASVRVIAYQCQQDGSVRFIVGDSLSIPANSRDIIIDNVAYRLDGTLFPAPQEADLDGSVSNTLDFNLAAGNVSTWLTVTLPAGTLAAGQHSVNVDANFSIATGLFLPWNTNIDCGVADSDGDGVPDVDDAFPNDPTEQSDNDMDGIGDNADTDDDNDGLRDDLELILGTDPNLADTDNDGINDDIDPDPLGNGMLALEGLATFIRDVTLSPAVISDDDLRNRRLRRPLRNRMTFVIRLIRAAESSPNSSFGEFFTLMAIFEIEFDLLPKTDGFLGGNTFNDWVVDEEAQALLYNDLALLSDLLQSTL